MDKKEIRVRFAPSPTGHLHIGGARTALFNWLFAKHHNGKFILRIDDTDENRSTDQSMQQIYDSLKWLGLNWDEGATIGGDFAPYSQSKRTDIYREYAQKLIDGGNAYRCYCTPDRLAQMRKLAQKKKQPPRYDRKCLDLTPEDQQKLQAEGIKSVIRLKIPDHVILLNDLVLGEIKIEASALQDEVIVKSNGSPLYNLTSIVDDHEMKITHLIRGADHLSNTPKQILIAQALGFELPKFAHLPMVLGSSKGEKLSKRHGATSIEQYKNEGYLPEAMINFLVRLGWSFDGTQEIFSKTELIEKFDLHRVGKSGSVFDLNKLKWLNKHYIMKMDLSDRTSAVIPFLQRENLIGDEISVELRSVLEKAVDAVGDRLATLADVITYTSYLFSDDFDYDAKGVKKWLTKGNPIEILSGLRQVLSEVEPFELPPIEKKIWEYFGRLELKPIKGMQPLRLGLTGKTVGPGLFEIVVLLGRQKVIARLDRLIGYLEQ